MKNYFAKYLPVEGGFSRSVKDDNGVPIDYQYEVKLFLCSREASKETQMVNSEVSIPREFHLEIIGEISKAALSYVKEGDEFNEEDVRFYSESYVFSNRGLETEREIKEDWIEIKTGSYDVTRKWIEVKGPCEHFH